jgi:hypothetical protein
MLLVDSATAQEVSTGKKLRILDGPEEPFRLSENSFPRTRMSLAGIEGPTTW